MELLEKKSSLSRYGLPSARAVANRMAALANLLSGKNPQQIDDTTGARLASAGAAAFMVYILGHGLNFLTQLVLARHLGAAGYGLYSYALACISVLAYFAAMGFNVSLLRFIPLYMAERSWPLLAGLRRYAERCTAFAGLGLGVLLAGIVVSLGATLSEEARQTFLIAAVALPAFGLVIVRCAVVRACGGVVASLLPLRVARDAVLLLMVATAYTLGIGRGPSAAMSITAVAILAALWLATRSARHFVPLESLSARPDFDTVTWRAATLPLLVVAAGEAVFDKTGTLVLGLTGNTKEAGLYALAFNMALLAVLPRTAIDAIFAPTLARLYAECKRDEMQRIIVRASLLSTFGAACTASALALAAGPVLSWYGPEFVDARGPLVVLLLGQLFAAASGSQILVLAMTGNEAHAARILVTCAFVNILLSTALVATFGLIGAAIATSMTIIGWNVWMARAIHRELGFWPGLAGLLRPSPP
jgi:O-antigen/teichoic acid export membrane protein